MHYQVGGSLASDAPTYITRQADIDLYDALQQGQFCYVLSSRQMGKSSLLVRTQSCLQQQGYCCVVVGMTQISSENITPLQWYKGLIKDLWRGFNDLRDFDLQAWWKQQQDLSLPQRLSCFLGEVVLKKLPNQQIVIFIDEIDSILHLPFAVDDFFALIRFCYHQRTLDPNYQRLNFAIFGVGVPTDLMPDQKRTPFSEGVAIALKDFTATESQSLAAGLGRLTQNPQILLQEIFKWTNGQPFLTQKLCQMAIAFTPDSLNSPSIADGLAAFVNERVIDRWEWQDEPEHMRTIRDRLLHSSVNLEQLLAIYQQVLRSPLDVALNPSRAHTELLLSGLLVEDRGYLRVKNRIYAEIFNCAWMQAQQL